MPLTAYWPHRPPLILILTWARGWLQIHLCSGTSRRPCLISDWRKQTAVRAVSNGSEMEKKEKRKRGWCALTLRHRAPHSVLYHCLLEASQQSCISGIISVGYRFGDWGSERLGPLPIITPSLRWDLISKPSLFSRHRVASSKQDPAARAASNKEPAQGSRRPLSNLTCLVPPLPLVKPFLLWCFPCLRSLCLHYL